MQSYELETILLELPVKTDLTQALDDDTAAIVVEWLEKSVQRYRFDNPACSVQLAELVIQVGRLRENLHEVALGRMLYADSLWQSGQSNIQIAWEQLEQAACDFEQAGDELGWARTRIGRLLMCYDMGCVDSAFADADRAEQIFITHNRPDKILSIRANKAFVRNYLGQYEQALVLLQQALQQAKSMGQSGEVYIAALCRSIGYAYSYMGNLDEGQHYYQKALDLDLAKGWEAGVAVSKRSLAYITHARGDYRSALRLLLDAAGAADTESEHSTRSKVGMSELYLEINRFSVAGELAAEAVATYKKLNKRYDMAVALMYLGYAQKGLRRYEQAMTTFDQAEAIFQQLDSDSWLAAARMQKGLVALRKGDIESAKDASHEAAIILSQSSRKIDLAHVKLLEARIALQSEQISDAHKLNRDVLDIAYETDVVTLKYNSQFLMGEIAEAQGNMEQAVAAYRAACDTIWQVQQDLTITLRPDFLADKLDAAHSLIRLYLSNKQSDRAFEMIERIKAQIVLTELTSTANFRWQVEDDRTRDMVDSLNRLRSEHQYVYRLLNPSPVEPQSGDTLTRDQRDRLNRENADREQAMRKLTEQLYLEASSAEHRQLIVFPKLNELQACLAEDAVVVAFYSDGSSMWAFMLTSNKLESYQLPCSEDEYTRLLNQLQYKIDFAIDLRDDLSELEQLLGPTQQILEALYRGLLQPLVHALTEYKRLIIVPYGGLHYLPFAALYDGQQYLIEQFELVTLPAVSLLTHQPPHYDKLEVLSIGHSWNGYLQSALEEATIIHELCGGEIYVESAAQRSVLQMAPCKILHIAAHGEFRMDDATLSYIQLEDGQVLADDLLQNAAPYELVVLSACETGRADIAPGDELIGLGRGFLYAGTGAIITTLWQIDSVYTLRFMHVLYRSLLSGESKAASLQTAQKTLLRHNKTRHPIFWAPFQLIGNADAIISTDNSQTASPNDLNRTA